MLGIKAVPLLICSFVFCHETHLISPIYVDGFVKQSIHKKAVGGRKGVSLPLDRWWGLNLHEFVIDLIEITFIYCSQVMLGRKRKWEVPLQKCGAVKILQKVTRESKMPWVIVANWTAHCWPQVRHGQTPHICISSPPFSQWRCLSGVDGFRCDIPSLGKLRQLLTICNRVI